MSECAFGNFPLAYKSKGKCPGAAVSADQGELRVPSTGSHAGRQPEVVPSSAGEAAFSQGSRHL